MAVRKVNLIVSQKRSKRVGTKAGFLDPHLTIWKFLKKLMAFQVGVDVDIRALGENGPPKKRKNDKFDSQAKLCNLYKKSNSLMFICEIAKVM